jgi:hypothetical protein
MDLRTLSRRANGRALGKSRSSVCRESPTHPADFAAKLAKKYEPTETSMPLLIWLSAFSYWRRVNAEMARVTLQFLDHVERPHSPQTKNAMVLNRSRGQVTGHENVRARTGDLRG